MKVTGLLNDDEVKEATEFISDIMSDKNIDFVESGFFGIKKGELTADRIFFDAYRVIGTLSVSKEEAQKIRRAKKG